MNKKNYRVTRNEYKIFLNQVDLHQCEVKEVKLPTQVITRVLSKARGVCLCERVSYLQGRKREEYFILRDPADNERKEVVPKAQVELSTPQEVQAVIDGLGLAKNKDKVLEERNGRL